MEPLKLSTAPSDAYLNAKRAAAAVRALGGRNPFFDDETIYDNRAGIAVHASRDGQLWIDNIRAFQHKDGAGSELMRAVCEIADKHGVTAALFAVPLATGPKQKKIPAAKLIGWYKRFGFKLQGDDYMERAPHNPA